MNLYAKQKEETQRVFKKLMKKWLTAEQTEKKASLLLAKNPWLKGKKSSAGAISK